MYLFVDLLTYSPSKSEQWLATLIITVSTIIINVYILSTASLNYPFILEFIIIIYY